MTAQVAVMAGYSPSVYSQKTPASARPAEASRQDDSAGDMAPQLGATFVPGGFDDYYMPEVVAPSPQRVTPQVPQNMQEDLQRLELEATNATPPHQQQQQQPPPPQQQQQQQQRDYRAAPESAQREASLSTFTSDRYRESLHPPAEPDAADADVQAYRTRDSSRNRRVDSMTRDAPSFSPFPKVKGDNIPPTDTEKEEILWNARNHVLHSQNVNMQIVWARDVLAWAEISMEAAVRETGDKRPSTPRIEHELRADALSIISHLAEQDHPQALYMRSKWLEFGKFGNRIDKREAYMGYKRAADLGNARCEYRIGMLFEQSNDMSKAKEHYYKGLSLKDSAALYRMGMMSLLGQHGESRDYATGLERIQLAADAADEDAPQGAYVYGMLVGRDLPDIQIPDSLLAHNAQTARMYIEKSAYLGFAKAQLKMGQAFELCQFGCDFNPSLSLHYYGLAAKQGLPEAALGVSRWFLFGYEGVFKKNEELAYKYAQEAAAAKLATGEFALGYYNEIGIHVHKSAAEARKWYQLAADHGNKDAISRLESLDHDKMLSKQDHETTTLGRIKSQHGSQRGKRPDRFKQPSQMPTLSEGSAPSTPANDGPSLPPKLGTSPGPSPRVSPGLQPTVVNDQFQYPNSSRTSSGGYDRAPAFNMRLDPGTQPARAQSAAPYPDDDRPAPLNVRPKSTAPYPEDDVRAPAPSGYPAGNRPVSGPQADRPMSAFGIRTQPGPGQQRPIAASQSMGNLQPDDRGRLPSGHGAAGFHQHGPGPNPSGAPYPNDGMHGRPMNSQPYPSNNPTGGRPPSNQYPPRDYDQRTSQHGTGPAPQNYERHPRVTPAGSRPERLSSLPQQPDPRQSRVPSGPHRPPTTSSYPSPTPGSGPVPGRIGTAPPAGAAARPPEQPAPLASAATAPAKPSKGPATFEDMGIPQGKQDGDCVVM